MQRPEWSLGVALAIGLAIGSERERRKRETGAPNAPGVRTFALVSLLGAVTAIAGQGLDLLAGAMVAVGALIAFARSGPPERDLTGEVALMVAFALGVLAVGHRLLALEVGVLVAALLAYRTQIHRLVGEVLTEQELLDGLAFAIAAAVVLPLLPDRALDPFGLFNPFTLWRLVVVVMGLGALGYVSQRLVGARYGLVAAGLAAGLISASAAVAAMARRSREDDTISTAGAAGAMAALLSSLVYLSGIVVAVSPDLAAPLAPPLAAAVGVTLVYAILLERGAAGAPAGARPAGRAFNLGEALTFVALVAVFTGLARGLSAVLGDVGAEVGAAVTGLADAHAAGVSMATLQGAGRLGAPAATLGILLGLSTNLLIKAPIALALGSPAYARRVALGVILVLASLWLAFAGMAGLTGV